MPSASKPDPTPAQKFDAYAENYEALHRANVVTSGEDPEYFARYKLARLLELGARGPVLDYGCGIGNLTRHLVKVWSEVHGTDPSSKSLRVARERVPEARFWDEAPPREHFETVVLAGVLHHIPKPERARVLADVLGALKPGGRVVIFEHNPLNPLTQKAVRECPFDDDAVLLWPRELTGLLEQAHFRDVELRYIVFFPRSLAALRPLEPHLGWLCLGAQTMTVARR